LKSTRNHQIPRKVPVKLVASWSAHTKVLLPDVWLLSRKEDARMSKKRHTAEEIIAKLRQVDVLTAQSPQQHGYQGCR
jgi:hypothetical protein